MDCPRIALSLAITLGGIAVSIPAASAAERAPPTLAMLLSGAETCFSLGGQPEGDFQRFKLKAESTSVAGRFATIPVHAVEHGLYQGTDYANMYAGTGTFAPALTGSAAADPLEITLVGAGFNVDGAGGSKIFTQDYVVVLDAATLTGKVYGTYSESKPLVNGAPYGDVVVFAVNTEATPMSCDGF